MKTLKDLLPLHATSDYARSASVKAAGDANVDSYVFNICNHEDVWDADNLTKELCDTLNNSQVMADELARKNKMLERAAALLIEARQERDRYKAYHTVMNEDMPGWEQHGGNPMAYWRSVGASDKYVTPLVEAWDKANKPDEEKDSE